MVVEMQMIKERMDFMMNALQGQVSSDLNELIHRTDSPFTTPVTSFPLPPKFRTPQVEAYDGSKDPLDHLESFKTLMHLQGMVDEIMCRALPTTLKGPSRVWFSKLTPNPSIPSRSWERSLPHTLSRGTNTRSPLHAWWASSNERTRRWGLT